MYCLTFPTSFFLLQVFDHLGVPVLGQRLMLKGKALDNSRTVAEIGLADEAKLHLFVTKEFQRQAVKPEEQTESPFFTHLTALLRQKLSPEDTKRVIQKFKSLLADSLSEISEDDVQRIARDYFQGVLRIDTKL